MRNNKKKNTDISGGNIQKTDQNEILVLVDTGSLVGKEFDFSRLDTLIMATPVPFRSVVNSMQDVRTGIMKEKAM